MPVLFNLEEKQRFVLVDALRGIAALSVVLFHAIEGRHISNLFAAMPFWLQTILHNGNAGVAIFFVLSGFVITHSIGRRVLTPTMIGVFFLKRSIRLDPPYWFAIALTIVMSFLASKIVTDRPPEIFSIPQIIVHLFYAQELLGFREINPVFWTLCLEIQFYIIFAILVATRSKLLFLVAVISSLLCPFGIVTPVPGLFIGLWYGFLLGAGAYWAAANPQMRWLFLVYAAIIFLTGLINNDVFACVCALTACALLTAAVYGALTTLLNWRWLQFLGLISYSLYLMHNPITGAVFRVGYILTPRSAPTEAIWWGVSLIACIIFSTAVWYLIERPAAAFSKRIRMNTPIITSTASAKDS
jgi:peptidoglycan/LPS O-acetylase OafA/YrhL